MAASLIQSAFSSGELSPQVYGRVDLAKYHVGTSTMRNTFVDYRGCATGRAGTKYVAESLQRGANPPRLIPFQFSIDQGYAIEVGNQYMRFISQGSLVTDTSSSITGITQDLPGRVSTTASFSNGATVFISGVRGMTEVNGLFYLVANSSGTGFDLHDIDNSPVDTTGFSAYTGGGTVAEVVTIATPYVIADVPNLKFTQSADTMSIVHPSYAPRDLVRNSATSWTLSVTNNAAGLSFPTGVSATASATTSSQSTSYKYCVTAVAAGSDESTRSSFATVSNSVDIATQAGTITVQWNAVTGATSYNVYRSPAAFNTAVPTFPMLGFIGTATSTAFIDTNITPDFTYAPPLNFTPFSASGDYPSVVAYFQQRRVYANTNNNPDTYWMSRPGVYGDFDAAIPTRDDDSIVGTPWAQQINGIQALVPMPGGLVVLTGLGAWQVNGAGGQNQAITPANQNATPQAFNGCASQPPPLQISYDILYIQAKGSTPRDLSYNFFVNIYTGEDLSIISNHLFSGYQITEWAWCEEPFKLVWAIRNDGTALALTFLKDQDVKAWSRHDTQGQFVSVCSVTEPPVDAAYFIVRRYVRGMFRYFIERMDNHIWPTIEDSWCVDCGLAYPQTSPAATLTASTAVGTAEIGQVFVIDGGTGYTSPTVSVDSAPGTTGSGATFSVTLSGSVIGSISVVDGGSGYVAPCTVRISDPTGTGFSGSAIIANPVTFNSNASVFSASNEGDVIRMGGGVATITNFISSTRVTADLTYPIILTVPDTSGGIPLPASPGDWTISTPTDTVSGLNHLEGEEVAILADGSVVDNQTVIDGTVTLPVSASSIVVGLPFICQMQTMYLDAPGGPTVAGKRKLVNSVTVRLANSRGISVGTNQPDAATQPLQANVPWENMTELKQVGNLSIDGLALTGAGMSIPLFTGDAYKNVDSSWNKKGQLAIQQTYPLPFQVLALIASGVNLGDSY